MTNEQKIKELKKRIECEQQLINNCVERQENLQAEIEELKKPKYELWKPINSKYYRVADFIGCTYDKFENSEAARYYAKHRQIFDALANFAAHYNPTEKDRAWDGKTTHWCLRYDVKENKYYVDNFIFCKEVCQIYFNNGQIAIAALEMLKSEKLI